MSLDRHRLRLRQAWLLYWGACRKNADYADVIDWGMDEHVGRDAGPTQRAGRYGHRASSTRDARSECGVPMSRTSHAVRGRIEVSLEAKVTAVARFVPDVVCTVAAKVNVPPTVSEVVADGVRLIRPGKRGGPGWDPPPHPVIVEKRKMETARCKPNGRNLPMHSSLFIAYESQDSESGLEAENLV